MAQLEMSLRDIATLARVDRPVASVWRRRHATADLPFPAPVSCIAGEERFDADSVVRWLESTGLGNSETVREDAAAHAFPSGIDPRADRHVVDALSALLCLRVVTGVDLADLGGLGVRALAEAADPDDTFLRREICDAGSSLEALAELADLRADAAFSSPRAFEQLVEQRFRLSTAFPVGLSLAPELHRLVEHLAAALAVECGAPDATYVEPTGRGNDLVAGCLLAADVDGTVICPAGDSSGDAGDTAGARLFRRRLRVHQHQLTTLTDTVASIGPAVLVLRLPDEVATSPAAMIDVVDEVALQLSDEQRAVIVAPASLLTDRLPDRSLAAQRSHVLRIGRVRAIIRLPRKLVTQLPRQALALWVLGPDPSTVDLAERRIATADVSDEPLSDAVITELVDDVVAAMADPGLARAHSFAQTRWAGATAVLAAQGSLVAPGAARRTTADAAGLAVEIEQLRSLPGPGRDPLGGAEVTPGSASALPATSVGRALLDRAVRMVPGNRHGFATTGDGNVAVLGVIELIDTAPGPGRRVDRLAFLGGWEANRLTEPGDVVFCSSPRPAAVVDTAGGCAVEFPARILRVHPVVGEGLSPHVLAHDINAQPAHAREWRSWPVRRVPASQLGPLTDAVTSVARERHDALARATDLGLLTDTLIRAVCDGALVLAPARAEPDPQET